MPDLWHDTFTMQSRLTLDALRKKREGGKSLKGERLEEDSGEKSSLLRTL